jgi:hypothetical protein
LPGNTLQIRGQTVCASIKGIPFEPCFNLDKRDERSFRGSVSGMGFAYCDFRHQGGGNQMLMARSSRRPVNQVSEARAAEAARVEASTRFTTPAVESTKLEPVRGEAKGEPVRTESAPELRRSTD